MRPRERRLLVAVVVIFVVVVIGGGIGAQSWRKAHAPDAAAPVSPAALAALPLDPTPLVEGQPVVLGRTDAPVTLTLYQDFHCPACADFEAAYGPLLATERAAGTVRVELYPVSLVDKSSTAAANGFACAAEAGFGERYYRGLLANEALRWVADQQLELATVLGEQVTAKFRDCVLARSHDAWVSSVNLAADRAKVTTTPTLLLDGAPVDLATVTPESLRTMISTAAAR